MVKKYLSKEKELINTGILHASPMEIIDERNEQNNNYILMIGGVALIGITLFSTFKRKGCF